MHLNMTENPMHEKSLKRGQSPISRMLQDNFLYSAPLKVQEKTYSSKPEKCGLHSMPFNLYCKEDGQPICEYCLPAYAQLAHSIVPIETAYTARVEELNATINTQVNAKKQELVTQMAKLQAKVQEKSSYSRAQKQQTNKELQSLRQKFQSIKEVIEVFEDCKYNMPGFLKNYFEIRTKLNNVLEKPLIEELEELEEVELTQEKHQNQNMKPLMDFEEDYSEIEAEETQENFPHIPEFAQTNFFSKQNFSEFLENLKGKNKVVRNTYAALKDKTKPYVEEINYLKQVLKQNLQKIKETTKKYYHKKKPFQEKKRSLSPPFLPSGKPKSSKHITAKKHKYTTEEFKAVQSLNDERLKLNMMTLEYQRKLKLLVFKCLELRTLISIQRKETLEDNIQQSNNKLVFYLVAAWNHYTKASSEKREVISLVRSSMDFWKKNRIFLAFKDFLSYEQRKQLKTQKAIHKLHLAKAFKNFCKWKQFTMEGRGKFIAQKMSEMLEDSRLKWKSFCVLKSTNYKTYSSEELKELKKEWLWTVRQQEKVIENSKSTPKYLLKGAHEEIGLLEKTRKPLFNSLNTKTHSSSPQVHEKYCDFQKFLIPKETISPRTMPSEQVIPLDVAEFQQTKKVMYPPEKNFKFGIIPKHNLKAIKETIEHTLGFYRQLREVSQSHHILKAINASFENLGKDINTKALSQTFHKWKLRFLECWLGNLGYFYLSCVSAQLFLVKLNSYIVWKNVEAKDSYFNLLDRKKSNCFKAWKNQKKQLACLGTLKFRVYYFKKAFRAWNNHYEKKLLTEQTLINSKYHYEALLKHKSFLGLHRHFLINYKKSNFERRTTHKRVFKAWTQKVQNRRLLRKVIGGALKSIKEKMSQGFRSDFHMLAEIIKAWRKVCIEKGHTKEMKIKNFIATNFHNNKLKIKTMFRWSDLVTKQHKLKLLKNLFDKCLNKAFSAWKNALIQEQSNLEDMLQVRNDYLVRNCFDEWLEWIIQKKIASRMITQRVFKHWKNYLSNKKLNIGLRWNKYFFKQKGLKGLKQHFYSEKRKKLAAQMYEDKLKHKVYYSLKSVFVILYENLIRKHHKTTGLRIATENYERSLKKKAFDSIVLNYQKHTQKTEKLKLADLNYKQSLAKKSIQLTGNYTAYFSEKTLYFIAWKEYTSVSKYRKNTLYRLINKQKLNLVKKALEYWKKACLSPLFSLKYSLNSIFSNLESTLKYSSPPKIKETLEGAKKDWLEELRQHEIERRNYLQNYLNNLKHKD